MRRSVTLALGALALCASSSLLPRALATGSFVSTTVFADAQCTGKPVSGPTLSSRALGECTAAGAVWTQLFVAADGSSIDDYMFFDAKCSSWLSATHITAGADSCVPFYDSAAQTVHYIQTLLSAPVPPGYATPPFEWPPADGLEFFRCTDLDCQEQCTSYRADRLGVCEDANAGNAAPGSTLKTCTRSTTGGAASAAQFYGELRFNAPGCNSRPMKANLWAADGAQSNRYATCNLYQSQRIYSRCPTNLSPAAATPWPLGLEVANAQYGPSSSGGGSCGSGGDAAPLAQVSLYANDTCAFGQWYAAFASGAVQHDYQWNDPVHCTPWPAKPTWQGTADQCVVSSSEGTSHVWTSTLSPRTKQQPFACAVGWAPAEEC